MKPIRDEQHRKELDSAALLDELTKTDWLLQAITPDYGLDFLLRKVNPDTNEVTSPSCSIQLKSTDSRRPKRGSYSFPMKVKHLLHYLEDVRDPVFLILVDLGTREAHWLFLQQYLLDGLVARSWKQQKTATVHVPIRNLVSNRTEFLQAVQDAQSRMAEIHPASIDGARKARAKLLSTRDPRFEFSPDGDLANQFVATATSDEPVSFSIHLVGDTKAKSRFMRDTLGRGLAVRAEEYGLTVNVTDLPGHLGEQLPVETLHARREYPQTLVLINESSSRPTQIELTGTAVGGLEETRIAVHSPSNIVKWSCVIDQESKRTNILHAKYDFSIDPWIGHRFGHLPQFDRIARFIREFGDDSRIRAELYLDGAFVFAFDSTEALPLFIQLREVIKILDVVNEVQGWLECDLRWNRSFSETDLEVLDMLSCLKRDGEVTGRLSLSSFGMVYSDEVAPKIPRIESPTTEALKSRHPHFTSQFQDQEVPIGCVTLETPKATWGASTIVEPKTQEGEWFAHIEVVNSEPWTLRHISLPESQRSS